MDTNATNRGPRRFLIVTPVLLSGLAGLGYLRALDDRRIEWGFPLDDSCPEAL